MKGEFEILVARQIDPTTNKWLNGWNVAVQVLTSDRKKICRSPVVQCRRAVDIPVTIGICFTYLAPGMSVEMGPELLGCGAMSVRKKKKP
jgi:hypothetical protein